MMEVSPENEDINYPISVQIVHINDAPENGHENGTQNGTQNRAPATLAKRQTGLGVGRAISIRKPGPRGTCLGFKDIEYSVPIKDPATGSYIERKILKKCTGVIRPGTLNALMGASGGGKTSLLDVLAGRKRESHVKGEVLTNGNPRDLKTFMHLSGYVVQDDIVMGTLTVRENLMFSADLRLPKVISSEDKARRVKEVINELGLQKVADSKVGNELVRGVSGGERKRVNIGMELITSPSILFLDEPTTGLDASTAYSVLKILKRQAKKGRTIVLSIHQPQAKIFDLFDNVILLTDGNIVYQGYMCGNFNNPADFLLDVLTGSEPRMVKDQEQVIMPEAVDDSEQKRSRMLEAQKELTEAYQKSNMAAKAEELFANEKAGDTLANVDELTEAGHFGANWLMQVNACSKRAFLNVLRDPATSVGQVVVNMIVGLIAGLIFYRIDQKDDLQAVLRDRPGCMFFICVSLQFSNLSAIEVFLKERVIFINEKASGYYRTSAYFVSKILCDMVPVRVIPTLLLGTVVYFMVGFQRTAEKFFWFELFIVLQSVVSASVCFVFSAMFSILAIANLSTTLWYVLMMIFSGLLVSINSWPDYSRWLGYTSFCKYSYELLLDNEFSGLTFPFACGPYPNCTGEILLSQPYLNLATDQKGMKIGALLIMIAGFQTIGYVVLSRLRKE